MKPIINGKQLPPLRCIRCGGISIGDICHLCFKEELLKAMIKAYEGRDGGLFA